jgi:hypothetical protein
MCHKKWKKEQNAFDLFLIWREHLFSNFHTFYVNKNSVFGWMENISLRAKCFWHRLSSRTWPYVYRSVIDDTQSMAYLSKYGCDYLHLFGLLAPSSGVSKLSIIVFSLSSLSNTSILSFTEKYMISLIKYNEK